MENWYKVTLPYGKGAALANQLQLAFEIAWEDHGAPPNAALFVNYDSAHEHEFIYFSPAAAAIATSILRKFEGLAKMTGDKFRIKAVKSYEVFDLGVSSDEPMDEPDEQQLYAWLRARGFSDEEAGEIINQVDGQGTYDIIMP